MLERGTGENDMEEAPVCINGDAEIKGILMIACGKG